MRKFNIDGFPQDRTYVLFDKGFHKILFDYIKQNFKFREFNDKHFSGRLNGYTFRKWKRRDSPFNKTHKVTFIPLWFVVEISKVFKGKFPITKIQRHIIGIHGPSSSKVIWNPKLPLIEDCRLIKILSHFIGDGFIGGGFGSKLPKGKSSSEYRNFNRGLLDQFSKDLQVFGNVRIHIDYEEGHLIIPNLIGYIIKHIYKIETDTFNSRLPKVIYKLDKKIVSSFIRGFGDDEGHVYESHIDFYSVNKQLLLDIMQLFRIRFPEIKISELKENRYSKNVKYYFYVLGNSQKQYLEKIGFDHKGKRESIIFNIKRRLLDKKTGDKGLTKRNILKCLGKMNMSSKQLSYKLYIGHSTILNHLNKLSDLCKVEIVGKGHFNENIWGVRRL